MSEMIIGTHCSYCGHKFVEQLLWPRMCFICNNESYKNPIPVVVTIVPVYLDELKCGWLIEQRNINPQKGGWAFPSGYIDFGETWQEAAVRELKEEVGLATTVNEFSLMEVVNSISGNMLIFCTHMGVDVSEIEFEPNREVSAIQFPEHPSQVELCFPTHNDMWDRYYHTHCLK